MFAPRNSSPPINGHMANSNDDVAAYQVSLLILQVTFGEVNISIF